MSSHGRDRAPYCSRCEHHWTEGGRGAFLLCPRCGGSTSLRVIRR